MGQAGATLTDVIVWLLWLVHLRAKHIRAGASSVEEVKPLEVKRNRPALLHAQTAFPRPRKSTKRRNSIALFDSSSQQF